MSTELAELSLVEAAATIATGRASSVEMTETCLTRIDRLQPVLNCFISIEADSAIAAARQADAARARRDPIGPLHGVPLAHKDMFYRAGKVSTGGSKIRRDFVVDTRQSEGLGSTCLWL